VYVPAGDKADYFTAGGGGNVGVELALPSLNLWGWWPWLSGLGGGAGLEVGYAYAPLGQNTDGGLQLYSAGGTLGLHYFLLSRLFLRADAALGLYQGVSPHATSGALWWRAGGDIGFRFSPSIVLSAGGGYGHYQNREGGPLYSGLYAGLRVQFTINIGRTGSGIELDFVQDDVVYPSLMFLYQEAPVGTLGIVNHEDAELRNVEVRFRAGEHTSSEFICGTIPHISRERRESLPLLADFSPKLMDFTENGRIAGEVVIRYSYLGTSRESVQSVVLRIAHRNSVPLGDSEALASLVSPNAPEILEYAKHVVGMARGQSRRGVNKKLEHAIWLFEGLLAAGLRGEEAASPDASASSDPLEELQYPAQTLAYRSGSATDIGLAYAAALEASGISAAFIALPDDYIVLFSLGLAGEQAGRSFGDLANLQIIDDQAWLPLSMAAFNEGFGKSWKAGLRRLDRIVTEGEYATLNILQEAWGPYPSVPFPALGVRSVLPDAKELAARAEAELEDYVAGEILPLIDSVSRQIRENGGTISRHNLLGSLHIQAKQMTAARAEYEKSAKMDSVGAMTTLGNMALWEKDFAAARRWFERALGIQPENRTALRGLEQIAQFLGE
jgi:tetratricopeptide (TPR) repeat protein